MNSYHIKFVISFLNIAIKATETSLCCFCIDCRFIFGFHTHDWTVYKAIVSLDCSPEIDGRAVYLSFYALIFIQLVLFFCWNYFFLMWARDLKCWLLLCAYWVEEWVGEDGADGFTFQGQIKTVISYKNLEEKNEKKALLMCFY